MVLKEAGVLVVATLSALAAGGGVLQFAERPAAQVGHVAKAADGHYWAIADVDGRPIRFLVDTGASAVMLKADDAARLDIDLKGLRYDQPVFTAAGGERAAAVTLDHVAIAGAAVEHVKALVMRDGLPASLLGMSYLGRLSRMEATPEALILSR